MADYCQVIKPYAFSHWRSLPGFALLRIQLGIRLMPRRKPNRTFAQGISSFIGRVALRPDQWVSRSRWLKIIPRRTPELAVLPTTYHFENDRKNNPAGSKRKFTLMSHRGIEPIFECHSERSEESLIKSTSRARCFASQLMTRVKEQLGTPARCPVAQRIPPTLPFAEPSDCVIPASKIAPVCWEPQHDSAV